MARQARHGEGGKSRGAGASKWRWPTRALLGAAGVAFAAGLGVGMILDPINPTGLVASISRPSPGPASEPAHAAVPARTTSARSAPVTPLSPIRLAAARPTTRPLGQQRVAPAPAPRQFWAENAVVHSVPTGTPMIAIILDDMGLDRPRSERATRLPGPLTLSYISYADDLIAQTGLARARGHELMLHLPMEPEGDADPGPGALLMKLSDAELHERIDFALGRFPGFVAINNHMGSRFTADPVRMRLVLGAIRRSGHLFLDSLTTPRAVALSLGPIMGVPTIARDVFLDDVDSQEEVQFRLLKAEQIAETEGTAIAIGHPRDATLAVLEDWIAERATRSAKLVPVSAIARVRLGRQQLVMIEP